MYRSWKKQASNIKNHPKKKEIETDQTLEPKLHILFSKAKILFKLTHYQPVQIPQSFRKILIHNLVNNLN
jgi:hypothetical protein